MNLNGHYKNLLSRGLFSESSKDRFSDVAISRVCKQLATHWQNAMDPPEADLVEEVQAILDDGAAAIRDLNAGSGITAASSARIQALEDFTRIDGSRPLFTMNRPASAVAAVFQDVLNFWKPSEIAIQQAAKSIGKVLLPGLPFDRAGTGFVIAENRALIPLATLQLVAIKGDDGSWRIFEDAAMDFGESASDRRKISDVLFCSTSGIPGNGFAVVQLKAAGDSPPPLKFPDEEYAEEGQPGTGTEILMVGIPGGPDTDEGPPSRVDRLFASLYGEKVAAAGMITGFSTSNDISLIKHDATVLRGSQGAVLVAADEPDVALGVQLRTTTTGPREGWCLQLSQALTIRDETTNRTLAEVLAGPDESHPRNDDKQEKTEPETTKDAEPENGNKAGGSSTTDINQLRANYLKFTEPLETSRVWQWKRSEQLSSTDDDDSRWLMQFEDVAAVSGNFHPDELIASQAADGARLSLDLQTSVLSQVATYCDTGAAPESKYWCMQPDKRTHVLNRLIQSDCLQPLLSDRNALPQTDKFGQFLREVLAPDGQTPAGETFDDLIALEEVAEIIQDLPLPHVNKSELKPDQIRRRLAKDGFLREYQNLTKGFVGREKELKQLRRFLESPWEESSNYDSLTVKGIGGAGKSSLVAKFAVDVHQQNLATVVVLDLDRPGITLSDHEWLNMEIARQVGSQYPETMELMRAARRTNREWMQQNALGSRSDNESASEKVMLTHHIAETVQNALVSADVADRPVLLIFDTFEIAMRNPAHLNSLKDWLSDMGDYLHPVRLRVIFTGREFEHDRVSSSPTKLTVDELPDAPARKLLEVKGVEKNLAGDIIKSHFLPHRPLELTLVSQMVTGGDDFSLVSLKHDLSSTGGFSSEAAAEPPELLKAGLIYRRILNRIDSPIARQLAFPGLVLRYVTAELVFNVLSPALELRLTEKEAQTAFDELRSHTWLVERKSDDRYWHRQDMRQLMMTMLSGSELEKADNISQRAIPFFEERKAEGDQVEAIYHRLRLVREPGDIQVDEPHFRKETLSEFANELLGEEESLSLPAVVLLKWSRGDLIPGDEVVALPKQYLEDAFDSAGRRLVAAEEYGKATSLIERGRQEKIPFTWEGPLPNWEIEALFKTCKWAELRELLDTDPGYFTSNARHTSSGLAEALFPRYLIDSGAPVPGWLEPQLKSIAGLEPQDRADERATQASQIAMALVMINHRERLSKECGESALLLLSRLMADKELASAEAENWIHLLRLALGDPGARRAMLAPSTLKIDLQWLSQNASRMEDHSRDLSQLLWDVHSAIAPFQKDGRRTARSLLARVSVFYRERLRWHDAAFELSPAEDWYEDLLRGCDWQFRTPLQYVLSRLYKQPSDWRRLAEMIDALIPFNLTDLSPGIFARAMASNPHHALEPYVEIVDRCWKLQELIEQVAGEFPGDSQIADLREVYTRWRNAAENAFATARENAPQIEPETKSRRKPTKKTPAPGTTKKKATKKRTPAKKKAYKKKAVKKKAVKKQLAPSKKASKKKKR